MKSFCIACKNPIPKDASICPECKSYQRNWKNHLQYFAGIVTLIVLTVSGLSWIYLESRKLVKELDYRDNVRVLSCNTLHSAVILNSGDGDVFLSHIMLYIQGRCPSCNARRLNIEEVLPKGKFLRKEFTPPKISGSAAWLVGVSRDKFENLLQKAESGDPCLEFVFFNSTDSFLQEIQEMNGPKLNTFEVTGYLEYRSQKNSVANRVPINGLGVLRRDLTPKCKNTYYQDGWVEQVKSADDSNHSARGGRENRAPQPSR